MRQARYKQSARGEYYHIYNRGNQKNNIFNDENDYQIYLSRLSKSCSDHLFTLICYCLMPNHVHIVVRQNSETSPARLISSIHTSYAMIFNKKYSTIGHLFQDRYKQQIIDNDRYMLALIAYIHLNPVNARLCKYPKEYPWSSYREYSIHPTANLCDHSLYEEYGLKDKSFDEYVNLASKINGIDAFDLD